MDPLQPDPPRCRHGAAPEVRYERYEGDGELGTSAGMLGRYLVVYDCPTPLTCETEAYLTMQETAAAS